MHFIKKMAIGIGGLLFMSTSLLAIEEPEYKLLEKFEDIEIREYSGYILAETIVSSDFEDVGNEAFSRLAGYIGGENIRQESIEMTAPVSQETIDSGRYKIAFLMPSRFTLATLPKPKDERVQLREVPAKKVAVIQYSGTWSTDNYKEHEALLYAFISEKGYQIKGKPQWARYNAPFIPWFMRRNEIMIEIE